MVYNHIFSDTDNKSKFFVYNPHSDSKQVSFRCYLQLEDQANKHNEWQNLHDIWIFIEKEDFSFQNSANIDDQINNACEKQHVVFSLPIGDDTVVKIVHRKVHTQFSSNPLCGSVCMRVHLTTVLRRRLFKATLFTWNYTKWLILKQESQKLYSSTP